MLPFNQYITGETDSVATAELDRLVARYEWFTTARRARVLLSGKADPRLTLPLMFSPTIFHQKNATPETNTHVPTAEERIIERFLEHGGYRIVPDDGADDEVLPVTETLDYDDGIVTEELAEIYRSQGLYAESKEIYRKLSLLNPEKSIYFADVIAQIDKEKDNN